MHSSPALQSPDLIEDAASERHMIECPASLAENELSLIAENLPAFDDFAHWIPRYVKPAFPCEYCRSKGLECFVRDEGQSGCSSCITLFRPCSFSKSDTALDRSVATERPNAIDTLHGVSEDAVTAGALTGTRAMRSTEASTEARPRKNGARFSREALRVLKRWISEHAENPYPTNREKDDLKRDTGLKRSQISNWLANARRRGKVVPPPLIANDANATTSRPIDIPFNVAQATMLQNMNPLERWKVSPPENEPASLPAIANAVARSAYVNEKEGSSSSSSWAEHHKDSSTGSSFSALRAPSMSSLETGRSSGSEFSLGSAFSHPSQNSYGSADILRKKEKKRRRRPALSRRNPTEMRIFQCTFCTDTFKTKHDWQRHEKTLHLSVETWHCAPMGGLVDHVEGEMCVFCKAVNPPPGHLDIHNYDQCREKTSEERTFYRKDHLRQHLRLMHSCAFDDAMDSWKSLATDIKSRCGFCNEVMSCWLWRTDHLSAHFKAGSRMSDWRGDWGFEPHVLELLEDAIPPYLIDYDRQSPFPFSATRAKFPTTAPERADLEFPERPGNTDHTCYKLFERVLAEWTRQQLRQGIHPSDEMLQSQGRRILFENTDAWDQTAADNPIWLEQFKLTHGLMAKPECLQSLDGNLASLDLGTDEGWIG
ncbi:MAG: hypothetical protein M1825_001578 [Sarcosagium campestre]|nr:MAG: hypothetical protein M1825_001578 [Sarcosagium campestre]